MNYQSTSGDFARASQGSQASLVPMVVEREGNSERAYDIFSRLLKDRIILVSGPIDGAMAEVVCAQLQYLESQDPDAEIHMYINSPGGSVTAGLAIYDTMANINAPVATYGRGMCASMASFLLAAGTPGKRYILPNVSDMAHRPSSGAEGTETQIRIAAERTTDIRLKMEELYAHFIGVPYDEKFAELIDEAMEHDAYYNAIMAIKAGLADEILKPKDMAVRGGDYEVAMRINQKEYDRIGKSSSKALKAAKKLIDAREAYIEARTNDPAVTAPSSAPQQPHHTLQ